MSVRRAFTAAFLGVLMAAVAAPAAHAADQTVINYSIKEARAFMWEIHYPQSTFISEKYGPCVVEDDTYGCDRTDYNKTPGSCPADVALGRDGEAPETPTPDELDSPVTDDGGTGEAVDWPKGNVVTVVHGLASGRLSSTPESGGFASMYYVDNSGRRETEAHVESDGFVGNRSDYEERCAVVDAFSETGMYPGPFNAHMLSRATQGPSTYDMAAFSAPAVSAPPSLPGEARSALEGPIPPGQAKESVAIVKLWAAGGKVHGLLASTVRGATLADGITVDVVRSIISFTSDGTKEGLVAQAETEAAGINVMGTKVALTSGQVIPLSKDIFLGVIRPIVQASDDGHRVTIRAPGLFLAAKTSLNDICIPEDPFNGDPFQALCSPVDPLNGSNPFPGGLAGNVTLGGKLFGEQVVYVAGAALDAGIGRGPAFDFIPSLPPLPLPTIPPIVAPPVAVPGPAISNPGASQPVALPRFEIRELAGSPWPLIAISIFTAFALFAIMGRWSMRWALFRKLSRYPPFPAFGWAYRAFLKG
jgi:hypothetical protein